MQCLAWSSCLLVCLPNARSGAACCAMRAFHCTVISVVSNIIQHSLLICCMLLTSLNSMHLLYSVRVFACVYRTYMCICSLFQVAPSSSSPHILRLSLQSVRSTAARPCQWVQLFPSPIKTHTYTHKYISNRDTHIHTMQHPLFSWHVWIAAHRSQ